MLATGIRIPKWSMRFFQVASPVRAAESVATRVRLSNGTLAGTVANPLPFTLRNSHVISKWNHASLGDIPPGASKRFTLPLRLPATPLPHKADPNTYLYSRVVFSKDAWWPNPFSEREREFLNTVVDGWSTVFQEPVLVGWGEPALPPPRLAHGPHSVQQMHLYAFRLAMPMEDPDIQVPPSVSVVARAATILATADEEQEPEFWEGRERGDAFEFDMPFTAPRMRTNELNIHAHFSSWSPDAPAARASLSLTNWQTRRWERIARNVKGRLDMSVPDPSRFVKLPEGMVRAKIDWGQGYYWGKVDWFDISYKGKRL